MQDPPDCLTCGACCAPRTRWQTYVAVTPEDEQRLPAGLRLQVLDGELKTRRHRGGVRCVFLQGELGRSVSCAIHSQRPVACRDFERGSEACFEARRNVLKRRRVLAWEV